jgi:hypothetical protein
MKKLALLSAAAFGVFALTGYVVRSFELGPESEVACGDHEKPASPTPAPAPSPAPKPKPAPKPAS